MTSFRSSWLSCPYPRPRASQRLFCLPYAGGSSWIYQDWGQVLPDTVEVCSIELPGHGKRLTEPPLTQLAPLVSALAEALRPWLDRPFACFGHSLGGLIAFELLHYLRQTQQIEPFHFWVSAARAPHLPNSQPPLHRLPNTEFLSELRRYNGTPTEILDNAELMELLLPTLRADFAILETYHYRPYPVLSCPIIAFWGDQDEIVEQAEVNAWQAYTGNSFTLQSFSGGHFFVHERQIATAVRSHFLKLANLA